MPMQLAVTEHDRCPACKKKTQNLIKDRGGLILQSQDGAIICVCGNHYSPKSMVAAALEQARSPIIQPGGGLIVKP